MSLSVIRRQAIAPALALLPARMASRPAELLMLAIHLQEDPQRRQQQVGGPARGIWQFERGGGVRNVLDHPASRPHAIAACSALGIEPTEEAVYRELRGANDVLDAVFARLLLWAEPAPLPAVGDVEGGFQYYLRTWRPGAYARGSAAQRAELRRKWGIGYARAMDAMQEAA